MSHNLRETVSAATIKGQVSAVTDIKDHAGPQAVTSLGLWDQLSHRASWEPPEFLSVCNINKIQYLSSSQYLRHRETLTSRAIPNISTGYRLRHWFPIKFKNECLQVWSKTCHRNNMLFLSGKASIIYWLYFNRTQTPCNTKGQRLHEAVHVRRSDYNRTSKMLESKFNGQAIRWCM